MTREASPVDSNIWSHKQHSTTSEIWSHMFPIDPALSVHPEHKQLSSGVGSSSNKSGHRFEDIDESHQLIRFARPVDDEYWDWTRFAVVYYASIIRYTFTQLKLVGEFIPTLIDEILAYQDKHGSKRWLLTSLFAFIRHPAIVNSNTLRRIEREWTGRKTSAESTNNSQDVLAFLRYRTYFGYDHWKITRDLLCITCRDHAELQLLLKCILQRIRFERSLDLGEC